MMTTLSGTFTLKIITSVDIVHTLQLDFKTNNEVDCPQLGAMGRYHCEHGYLSIGFGNPTTGINVETNFCMYGRMTGPNQFEGVMVDTITGQPYAWEAQPGSFSPKLTFGPVINLPTWPPKEFVGEENPGQIHSTYQFNYLGVETGEVTVGVGNGTSGFTGKFTSKTYPAGSQQLLVFSGPELRVYGAEVHELPDGTIRLENGQYMTPLVDTGRVGTWHAH